MESGAEDTRLPPLQWEGDRRAVEGFRLRVRRAECGKLRAEFGEWRVESEDRCAFLIANF